MHDWGVNAPAWAEVVNPKTSLIAVQLDSGESEAIAPAVEVHADLLLIDEQAGWQEAIRRGLRVAGTLPILDDAEQAGARKLRRRHRGASKNQFSRFADDARGNRGQAVSLNSFSLSIRFARFRDAALRDQPFRFFGEHVL